MTITKNKQSEEIICKLVKNAYPLKEMQSYRELTEGLCNVAYLITFTDGEKRILKIAAPNRDGYMTNEINLMEAEVCAMQLVKDKISTQVAEIDLFDKSKQNCSGNYFFMTVLDGDNYFSVQENFSEEEKEAVSIRLGELVREIAGIKGEKFGLIGDGEHRFDTQYDLFYYMLSNVIADADRKSVDYFISGRELLDMLKRDKEAFAEVRQPSLVHYDMWEGNVFVKDKQVTGLIDWERALWGDVLMEDRFRRHTRTAAFLKGYGREAFSEEQEYFSEAEKCRILWYDCLLFLTMMTEGEYRRYGDDSQYRWVAPLFEASLKELRG
ncbi:MAG: phosphotransferase family protein [Lachnospiraceae bacterium]